MTGSRYDGGKCEGVRVSVTRASSSTRARQRAQVFRLYGNVCVRCGETATDIDHIIELAAGGTDDLDNLQPLCSPCHKAKTAAFNRARNTRPKGQFFGNAQHPRPQSMPSLSEVVRKGPPIRENAT